MPKEPTKFEAFMQLARFYGYDLASEQEVKDAALAWLAQDPEVVPNLLQLLSNERKETKQLVQDMNVQLTTQLFLQTANKRSKSIRELVTAKLHEAHDFYEKWAHRVSMGMNLQRPS